MEVCAKLVVDSSGKIQKIVQEISCNQQVVAENMGWTSYVVYAVIAAVGLTLIFGTLFVVKQKTVEVIERFGRFKKISKPGLNIKIPFVDQRVGELSTQIRELSETVEAKSKDNAFVEVPVKVQYQVVEGREKEAFYELENAQTQISSYIVNVVRSEATNMDMEELFSAKAVFEQAVETELNERFGDYGYKIINVLVDDPLPAESVIKSFNRVIASQREKEAATNEAEALRIKTVANAKAEAESLELKATAYVKQRNIIAKGMKEIGIESDALIGFLERIDWRDTVRDASQNQASVIMIPSDMEFNAKDVAKIKSLQ